MNFPFTLPQQSLFAFPGRLAGVDNQHPAATALRFSAVASSGGAGAISLTKGKPGVPTAVTPGFWGIIGPAPFLNSTTAKIAFSGQPTTNDTSVTMAAIVVKNAAASFETALATSGGNSGWRLEIDMGVGGAWGLTAGAVAAISSTMVLAAKVPYFICAAVTAGGTCDFVSVRLDTGQMRIVTGITAPASVNAPDGTCTFGYSGGTNAQSYIAAIMYSAFRMPARAMLAWAADPWSFWYPNKNPRPTPSVISGGVSAATATASGVGAATAIGASTAAGNAAASGIGAAAATGTVPNSGTAAASGTGAAAAIGNATAASSAAAIGTGTAAIVGSALKPAATVAPGTGAATAVGSSTAAASGSAVGIGAAVGLSDSGTATGTAVSTGAAAATGIALKSSNAATVGTGAAIAVGSSAVARIGNAAGIGTAAAIAQQIINFQSGAGAASGTGVAAAVGRSTVASIGNAPGLTAAFGNSGSQFIRHDRGAQTSPITGDGERRTGDQARRVGAGPWRRII